MDARVFCLKVKRIIKLNTDLGLVPIPKKISSCITNPALVIFNILLSSMGKLLLDNPFVYQKAEIFMI